MSPEEIKKLGGELSAISEMIDEIVNEGNRQLVAKWMHEKASSLGVPRVYHEILQSGWKDADKERPEDGVRVNCLLGSGKEAVCRVIDGNWYQGPKKADVRFWK